MFSDERLTEEFGRLPTPYPPRDTGALFIATFPLSAGVTFTLKDATGNGYYLDEDRRMQWGLDATTAAGAGGFVEVGPGDVQVEVGGAAERCFPGAAWPGNDSNRISMPVRDGYITYATVICTVP